MDLIEILGFRILINVLLFIVWIITGIIALESCDISSTSSDKANDPMFWTIFSGAVFEMSFFIVFIDPFSVESRTWNLSKATVILVGKILLVFPIKSCIIRYFGDNDEWRIDRLFEYATMCYPINGTHDFEYCIDPSWGPSRCDTIARRQWNIPELILALIIVELIAHLLAYWIDWSNWMDRRHRASIWWHQRIALGQQAWHDHEELIAFLTKFAYDPDDDDDDDEGEEWSRPFNIATVPVIDLNTKSDDQHNIDRLIYSMVIYECRGCESDDGNYLVLTTSDFHRKCRLVKISSTIANCTFNGTGFEYKIRAFIMNGLVMCIYVRFEDERTRFLLYNLRDDSKREFDMFSMPEIEKGRFWCLDDDGRDMGREIEKEANYVRLIYYHVPSDQAGVEFSIRQCLLEIPCVENGEIEVKQLQETTYGSNWKCRDCRLIRTTRGHVGMMCELSELYLYLDRAIWTTCVVYSPETRRLSATGDYEKYLEIDPSLRLYFDRTVHEYENLRFKNMTEGHKFDRMFLCPQVLTDARAIDVLENGSIRSIDFEPRSLKWLCLRKFDDAWEGFL